MERENNDKLIQKYEEVSSKYVKLVREILTRYLNKELTEEEFEKFKINQTNLTSYIADSFSKKITKEEIIQGAEYIFTKCLDENR